MKTLTIKVPDALFTEIASDAKARNVPKSEIVRERLTRKHAADKRVKASLWSRMEDVVIRSDSLPDDLSSKQGAPEKLWQKPFSLTPSHSSPRCGIATGTTRGRERTSRQTPSFYHL